MTFFSSHAFMQLDSVVQGIPSMYQKFTFQSYIIHSFTIECSIKVMEQIFKENHSSRANNLIGYFFLGLLMECNQSFRICQLFLENTFRNE